MSNKTEGRVPQDEETLLDAEDYRVAAYVFGIVIVCLIALLVLTFFGAEPK